MTLTLELTESSGAAPAASHVFGEDGGTIGRAQTNGWVLPHNKVSGLHARISFRNGTFYIEDASRNGVCVNSPENRLVAGRPYALKTGDRLFIEPYEVGVWIGGADAAPLPLAHDPFGGDDPFFAGASASPSRPSESILPESPVQGEVDPLKFFDAVGGPPPRKRPVLPMDDGLGQHYQPPPVVPDPTPPPRAAAPAAIPAGYNPLADDPFGEPSPAPPTPAPIRPRPGDSGIIRARAREAAASLEARRSRVTPPVHPSPPAPEASPAPPPPAAGRPAEPAPVAPDHDPLAFLLDTPAVQAPPAGPASRPAIPSGRREQPLAPPAIAEPPAPAASVPPAADDGPFVPPAAPPPTPPVRPSPGAAAVARQPIAPPPAGVDAVTPSAGGGADLVALLAGAGVPDAVVTPELARHLGGILRVVVVGLMDVLQSRQRIKEEFRMQQTIFRPADNNPLKFSVNVEDALHNLLVKRNPAYLGPDDAFADAFDDLRDHQLAMLAGMRVAFEAMLAEFDPERMQQEFDTQLGKSSLALVPAKLRYWDLYRARRAELVKDPEEAFERLFGDEFRRAYEDQFRKLKAQRRSRASGSAEDTLRDRS